MEQHTSNSGSSANETTVNNAPLTLEQSLLLAETNALRESEQWQARAKELCEASKVRRATARNKLLVDYTVQKDDEMDSDEEQARAKAFVAKYCSDSLYFQTTLSRLIHNDQTLVEIDALSNIRFPRGHGQPLGEALLCNKVVKTLKVHLHEFLMAELESYSLHEIRPLLKFVTKSTSLVHFEARGYLREHATPRVLELSHLLLDAISKNKQMEQLTWALPVCSTALCIILASLTLVDLNVSFQGYVSYSDTQQQAIAAAFRSNTSLQYLSLDTQGDVELAIQVLQALARAQCLLKYLRLVSCRNEYGDYYDALSLYLRSTLSLERLHLTEFELFGRWDMATLLSGLQQHRDDESTALPETHLRSLVLSMVQVDQEAGEELVKFLQTATANPDGKEVYKSRFRDLHVLGGIDDSSFPRLAGQIAESLLMATGTQNDDLRADELHDRQLPVLTPTIGSQIHSLSLVRAHDVFLYHLRDHADRVRLHTLELEGDFDDGIAFYKCIPQLVSLRKLKLFPSDLCDRNEYWIVRGLRENGSIVEVETEEDGRSAFSAAQLRLIDAYCQRNRMLNELVVGSEQRSAERGGEHNDNGIDIGNTVDGDVKDHGVSDDGTDNTVNAAHRTVKAELLHRPSMFQCAEQIPRTHATMLIRGLAVLGDGIGF